MSSVTRTTSHVTADHIRYLAASTNSNLLVDTTNGIALVPAGTVTADGSNVTRVLLSKGELLDACSTTGITLTAYLDANAVRIAAELNELRAE